MFLKDIFLVFDGLTDLEDSFDRWLFFLYLCANGVMNAGHYFIIYSCIWPDILEKGWGMDCTALSLNLEKIILKYIERNKKNEDNSLGLNR